MLEPRSGSQGIQRHLYTTHPKYRMHIVRVQSPTQSSSIRITQVTSCLTPPADVSVLALLIHDSHHFSMFYRIVPRWSFELVK